MAEGMFRPFRYCYGTWKDGGTAFRHELIETRKDWTALGFAGSCPFPLPTLEKMVLCRTKYRCFEAGQNLKLDMSSCSIVN